MKHSKRNFGKLLTSVALLALVAQTYTAPFSFLATKDWEVSSLKSNPGWAKFTLKTIEDKTTEEKLTALGSFKISNFFLTDKDGKFVNFVGVSSLLVSSGLADRQESLLIQLVSNVDLDGDDYRMYVQDPSTDPPATSSSTASTEYNEVTLGPFWVVKTDWEEIAFDVFKWFKRVMILAQFYLIFVRPALNKVHRIPIAWLGSSIMVVQTLFWHAYVAGSFGGPIDALHRGMILARKEFFGMRTSASYLSPNFVEASERLYQNKLFPVVDPTSTSSVWYPNPVIDSQIELTLLAFGAAFPFFTMAMKNRNLSRLAKSMKSGMVIAFAVPVLNNSIMCIIQLFWSAKYRTFEIGSAIVSVFIIAIYVMEFIAFYTPHGHDAHYFNSEIGLIDFDCHYRAQVFGFMRRGEVWILLLIPTITWLISNLKLISPVVILVLYLLIMFTNFTKAAVHKKFRLDIIFFNQFKSYDNMMRSLLLVLMCLYWIHSWSNTWNKIFTWVYFIVFLFDLLLIVAIFANRIIFEIRKAYKWKEVAHLYPDRPLDLLDVNKALRSIGKGSHNIQITKGGYTQVAPNKAPKQNTVGPAPVPAKPDAVVNATMDQAKVADVKPVEVKPAEVKPVEVKK